MAIRESIDGFEVVGVENEFVRVCIVPQLGAKILCLTNRVTGREWMWAPPEGIRLFRNRTGDGFADGTKIGADECLPTVAACTWQGDSLPDHGEAWTEEWTLDEAALGGNLLVTRLRLPISPFEIERTISIAPERTLHFEYRLRNVGDMPREYLWALHPMMAIEPGDRLVLPSECTQVRADATVINCELGERGTVITWPSPRPEMRLDHLEFGREDAAVKVFTEPLRSGVAAIRNATTGDYIAFSCEPNELNTYGIWINRGGWAGYHHVAIEPTNGAPDPLDAAVDTWKRFSTVAPGATVRWSLDIHLGVDADAEGDAFLQRFAR